MGSPRAARSLPRSAPILALLLLAAVLALVWAGRGGHDPGLVTGGALFRFAPAEIEGLLVTTAQTQFRLDRRQGGVWTLSGAVSDFVDQEAVANLLAALAQAEGGPLLPGTEPQDRRYEFNGPQAQRLVLFGPGGRREELVLGTVNPVTGMVYASGAERPGCFPVPAAVRATIAGLPDGVRAGTLLPRFPAEAVTTIDLERNGRVHRLRRYGGRWWLNVSADERAALGGLIKAYQDTYEDRRFTDALGTWYLAAEAEVGLLVFDVSRIVVRRLVPAQEQDALRQLAQLDRPWRRITLEGPGINPDPTDAASDRLSLAFGLPLENQQLPVLRRGNVLLADAEAVTSLDKPLGDLVHQGALTLRAITANELVVQRQGQRVLVGSRPVGPLLDDGRRQWVTTFPPAGQPGPLEDRRRAQAGELLIDLDRMEILAVLAPTLDPQVLQDDQRITVELVFGEPGGQGSEVFEVGYLATGPSGSSGTRKAALWRPRSGQLLVVDEQILVTVRNLAAR